MSNLSPLSCLVEKFVLLKFNKHCAYNTLPPDYQSAYRANYSCKTALVKMERHILVYGKADHCSHSIDLLVAFDTIDHEILLEVLQIKFGFTGQALHWFDSYLRQRGFKVTIEVKGQKSSICHLVCPKSVVGVLHITQCMLPPYRNAYQMNLDLTFMASCMITPTRNSLMPTLDFRSTKPCVIYPIVQVKSRPRWTIID